jgi:hypothetical protein
MPTTTPVNGWPVPVSTDLVKDGAVAIEALGDAIDASANKTWQAWTTFTPNIINFGVGAGGTSTGAYVLVGKTLHLRLTSTLGTGFNVSGALTFVLPAGLIIKSGNIFTYRILDNLSAFYLGLAIAPAASDSVELNVANAVGTYVGFTSISGSSPFLWAAGDNISLWMTCEVN